MTRNDGGGVGIAGDFLVSSYELVVPSLPLLAISLITSFPFLSLPSYHLFPSVGSATAAAFGSES